MTRITGRLTLAVLIFQSLFVSQAVAKEKNKGKKINPVVPGEYQSLQGLETLTGKKSPLQKGDTIVFLGDSITAAGGFHKLLSERLEEKRPELSVKVVNAGISGNKVPNCQSRLDRDVISHKPNVVFIYIGINDVWHFRKGPKKGTSKEAFQSGLHDLVKRCKDAGALVLLATPTTIGEKHDGTNEMDSMLDEYAAISRKVASQEGIPSCDLRKAFIDYLKKNNAENQAKGILTYDGVHMGDAGNALLCDQACAAIAAALSRQRAEK